MPRTITTKTIAADRATAGPLWIAAILAAGAAVTAWPLAILDLPQSGPWCRDPQCLLYPFTAARYQPIDYWWMYPATLAVAGFAALVALLEPQAPVRRRSAARLATLSATTGAAVLAGLYALQLLAVQPAIIKGEQDGLTLWTQFNPHGAFIALESLGYLLLSLALVAVARLVPGRGGLRRTVRIAAGGLGAVGVLALPIFATVLGAHLEYAYEVTAISLVWTAIVVVPLPLVRAVLTTPGSAGS